MVSSPSLRDGVVTSVTQSLVVSTFVSIVVYLNYFIVGVLFGGTVGFQGSGLMIMAVTSLQS